jgi:hypothetical protein
MGVWLWLARPGPTPCCWQALRSLDMTLTQQQDVAAAATLTQLIRLGLTAQGGNQTLSLSSLSTLTGLQSLSLSQIALQAGLSRVAQGCSSLTQLKLQLCRMPDPPAEHAAPPGRPPPPQVPCSWPALLELRLWNVQPGVVSHVLPQSAPLLARLAPPDADDYPARWPKELHQVSWLLQAVGEEQQLAEVAELAADVRCLAACPVPCHALLFCAAYSSLPPSAVWPPQLAMAVAPVAVALTHLSLDLLVLHHVDRTGAADSSAILSLCQALPQLHSLRIGCDPLPDLSALPLHRPPLKSISCKSHLLPSDSWVRHLLCACAVEQAAARPQLTVQLPALGAAALAAAKQQWAQLAARVPQVSRVVVTDKGGTDLLAA